MTFEEKYKQLIESICDGEDENILSYETYDNTWRVQAINHKCVALGETEGVIDVEAHTLGELLVRLEDAITQYNSKVSGGAS